MKFQETGQSILSFIGEFLVHCPHCKNLATIRKIDPENNDLYAPRRLACLHCGHTKDWQVKLIQITAQQEPPTDVFFGLPLFLTAPCCGHMLWAYNLKHLDLIESYIKASLRQHVRHEKYGWHNAGLVNRLPRWMTAANNRKQVLKTIEQLKLRLQKAT